MCPLPSFLHVSLVLHPAPQVYSFAELQASMQELLATRHTAIAEGGREMAKLLAASAKTLKINK